MVADWVVFVEGKDDEHFIKCLLKHINIANVDIAPIGGGVSKLPKVANEIKKRQDAGSQIAFVLDANSNFEERCAEFLRQKDKLELPDRFFLLPNNKDEGCLETLLEEMAIPDHRVVYDCLEKYGDCLRSKEGDYQLLNHKGRIYAYCEALNIETHPSKHNYGDPEYWNLNTPALEPLKQFLCNLHADPIS